MGRIVIVSAFFDVRTNYQEVVYERAFRRSGFDTKVICADIEQNFIEDVECEKLKVLFRLRDTIMPFCGGMSSDWDGVVLFVLMSPNHGFSHFVSKQLPTNTVKVAVFSDIYHARNEGSLFVRKVLKDRWYQRMFATCDWLVGVTPDTLDILRDKLAPEKKLSMQGLTFDEEVFHYQDVYDDVNVVTATRINQDKPLNTWIEAVKPFLNQNEQWRYIFLGGEGDSVNRIGDQIEILPVVDQRSLGKYFAKAKIGVWFDPTIAILQALATGMVVVIPDSPVFSYFARPGFNAVLYQDLAEISSCLETASKIAESGRWERAKFAGRFSSGAAVTRLIRLIHGESMEIGG